MMVLYYILHELVAAVMISKTVSRIGVFFLQLLPSELSHKLVIAYLRHIPKGSSRTRYVRIK